MDNTDLMLEIERKRQLPVKVKEEINANVLKNLLAALIVMAYLLLISITYYKSSLFEMIVKYYACGAGFLSIILFEIAYNKKNTYCLIFGIELLSCAIISVFIPYIYLHTTSKLRTVVIMLPGILSVYYIIKSMVIFKVGKIKYTNGLSDIKDILKSDKKSYLDEESNKAFRKKLKEEAEIKKEIKKEQEIRKRKRMSKKKEV